MRDESQFVFQNGLGSSNGNLSNILVAQAIPDAKKTEKWKKANMDTFERIAQKQFRQNMKFKDYYEMIAGRLTYIGSGLGDFVDMSPFQKDIKKISEDKGIPTYLKHYDFIGIVVNALVGMYMDFQDVFRVDSVDEYSTNEFIRQKTELLLKYGQEVFQTELNRLLVGRGVDLAKNDFQSEEEAQQYQQGVEQQKRALTPPEIEQAMAKNFKVLATEWAENTLKADTADFDLYDMDKLEFIDKLLTGRFFRHYRVDYDSYKPERWKPTNVFFSQTSDTRFPQECEYVGHIDFQSPSDIINTYGHLLTATQQESLSNYWNQNDNDLGNGTIGTGDYTKGMYERQTVPFYNFYDHQLLSQYEDALGVPLGNRTIVGKDGAEDHTYRDWLPQYGNQNLTTNYAGYHREDIDVDTSAIQVTQVYWRSYKRMGMLIYENSQGATAMEVVTDELLPEFLKENGIKKLKSVSLMELETAIKSNNLNDYINTIVYNYTPEIWKGIKLRNTSSALKEDIYLDVRPIDFQIRGSRSKVYNFLIPVGGIIGNSLAIKLTPYQIMHNMCMNQICDILEKEIGIFFLMDVNYLPSEFLKGGNQEDAILNLREFAKDAGFLPTDMSKQNAPTNPNVNSFQRVDLTYGSQVEYRIKLAEYFKQEGYKTIGITEQMLGSVNSYSTAEGVKQGQQANFIQLHQIFEEMNMAKCKMMEIHLAVAQYCQANGKDASVFNRKGDGEFYYLNIVEEDPDFQLRDLGVRAMTNSKDRKILETLRNYIISDNTIQKQFSDVADVFATGTVLELRQIANQQRLRMEKQTQDERDYQTQLQQNQIQSQQEIIQHAEDIKLSEAQKDRESKERIASINGFGRGLDNDASSNDLSLYKIESDRLLAQGKLSADISIKEKEIESRNKISDNTMNQKMQDLSEKVALKREEMANQKFIATVNKN